jgi:hypothetical protein
MKMGHRLPVRGHGQGPCEVAHFQEDLKNPPRPAGFINHIFYRKTRGIKLRNNPR